MNWGKIGVPQLNIKQAKQRFTRLTGIAANKQAITEACTEHLWLAICMNDVVNRLWHFETRKKEFWLTLINRIESNCTFPKRGK